MKIFVAWGRDMDINLWAKQLIPTKSLSSRCATALESTFLSTEQRRAQHSCPASSGLSQGHLSTAAQACHLACSEPPGKGMFSRASTTSYPPLDPTGYCAPDHLTGTQHCVVNCCMRQQDIKIMICIKAAGELPGTQTCSFLNCY